MYGPYAPPRGPLAARLRRRKAELLRRFPIPDDLLPGSLSQSSVRCGKPTCHCAHPKDPGHPLCTLTFMVCGAKHTLHIPKDWVQEVRRRVQGGRQFQQVVREVLAANAQLLALARQQRRPLPGTAPARAAWGRLGADRCER